MAQIVTVVIGWVIVHYLTIIRERQKEIRELKSKVVDRIYEIEKRAILFHLAANHNYEEGRYLMAEIERVASAIARQPLSLLEVDTTAIRLFRSSITLKNFDPSSFQSQTASSKLLNDISFRAETLSESLEQSYGQRYLTKWWQTLRI